MAGLSVCTAHLRPVQRLQRQQCLGGVGKPHKAAAPAGPRRMARCGCNAGQTAPCSLHLWQCYRMSCAPSTLLLCCAASALRTHLLVPSGSRKTRVDSTPAYSPKKSRRADSSTSGLNRGDKKRARVSSKLKVWLPHSRSPAWTLVAEAHSTAGNQAHETVREASPPVHSSSCQHAQSAAQGAEQRLTPAAVQTGCLLTMPRPMSCSACPAGRPARKAPLPSQRVLGRSRPAVETPPSQARWLAGR